MRKRARSSARRFGEDEFVSGWNKHVDKLVSLRISPSTKSISGSLLTAASIAIYMSFTVYSLWSAYR